MDSHSLSAWSEIRDNRDKESHFLIFLVSQSSLGYVILFLFFNARIYTQEIGCQDG